MSIQAKVVRTSSKKHENIRVQLLKNGDVSISVYGVGGDTAKCGNDPQLTKVARKFGLTNKAVKALLEI